MHMTSAEYDERKNQINWVVEVAAKVSKNTKGKLVKWIKHNK